MSEMMNTRICMWILGIVLCISLPGKAQEDIGSHEWKSMSTSYVYLSKTQMPWSEARNQCKKMGGDFPVIKSLKEMERIEDYLSEKDRGSFPHWLGMYFDSSEGQWEWLDGTKMDTDVTPFKSSLGLCGAYDADFSLMYLPCNTHLCSIYYYKTKEDFHIEPEALNWYAAHEKTMDWDDVSMAIIDSKQKKNNLDMFLSRQKTNLCQRQLFWVGFKQAHEYRGIWMDKSKHFVDIGVVSWSNSGDNTDRVFITNGHLRPSPRNSQLYFICQKISHTDNPSPVGEDERIRDLEYMHKMYIFIIVVLCAILMGFLVYLSRSRLGRRCRMIDEESPAAKDEEQEPLKK